MTTLLERILGINTKIRSAVLLFALAVLINRCPILITAWCPAEFQNLIFQAAHDLIGVSIVAALWFAKQSNVTGNDSPLSPLEKTRGSVDVRLLLGMWAVAIVFALSGCATFDTQTEVTSKYGTLVVVSSGTNKVTVTTTLDVDQVIKAVTADDNKALP
jgi:hypothetical protein